MRICLIHPLYGRDSLVTYSPPLGLAYIAAVLERAGHEAIIIDRVALKHKNTEIDFNELDKITRDKILEFQPDLIGIGAMTIQVYDLAHVSKLIHKMTRGNRYPIIVGGFHATAEPERTLKTYPEINIVCRGEGEQTMLELASGKRPDDIKGLTFKKNGTVHSTPYRTAPEDLDSLPLPARHLLDMNFYCRRNDVVIAYVPLKVATMLTSRGCPYSCKFCSSRLIFKSARQRSAEHVLEEINVVVENHPIEAISFVDSELLPGRPRLEKICRELIDKKLNRKFKWACSLRANLVDKEMLELMKEAGCIFVNYGFESGSQKMLDCMNKKVKLEDNYRAARLTHEAGILVNSAMIINLPEETETDIQGTIDFIKDNERTFYAVGLNPLLPLPGSPYYDEFLKKGILKYSHKLWEEVGILPESVEQVRLYSQVPRQKFVELYNQANRLAMRINTRNYIRLNWWRHPLFVFNKLAGPLFKKLIPHGSGRTS